MKKTYLIIAATALVALSACTKNEVRPASSDPQEITFQTVVGGVKTKAPGSQVTFNGDKFKSYAWFLPQGKTWAANYADAKRYISDAEISKNSEGKWKAANAYYWPKQGSLTFFSWTLLAPAITNPAPAAFDKANVTCTATKGIEVKDYDVSVNKNYDLMVADIAADKTKNENTYETDGVPTLFRHVLSNLAFTIATKDTYDGAEFVLTSITLKNVNSKGTYTQGIDATKNATEGVWSDGTQDQELPYISGGTVSFTKTPVQIDANGYNIVRPQTFGNDTPIIEIVYAIKTEYVSGAPVTETVTVTKSLKSIFSDGWKAGKKYIMAITIGLDEILWDPAVEDWTEQGYDITL